MPPFVSIAPAGYSGLFFTSSTYSIEFKQKHLIISEGGFLKMTGERKEKAKPLEKGEVYFFYRPKVEVKTVHNLSDVQRFYMVLNPDGERLYRLVDIGQKYLPDIAHGGRNWGFILRIGHKPEDIEEELAQREYSTKTRGEREVEAARPCGEGRYVIALHEDHTHFAYVLHLPRKPEKAQEEFNIPEQGSYIISVKNPEKPTPPGAGLRPERKVQYPSNLEKKFGDRRFLPIETPDLLNYQNAEILLIGASLDVKEDLGITLNAPKESEHSAKIFEDLKIDKSQFPVEPLFKGRLV